MIELNDLEEKLEQRLSNIIQKQDKQSRKSPSLYISKIARSFQDEGDRSSQSPINQKDYQPTTLTNIKKKIEKYFE